jgi:hypothetical protein
MYAIYDTLDNRTIRIVRTWRAMLQLISGDRWEWYESRGYSWRRM